MYILILLSIIFLYKATSFSIEYTENGELNEFVVPLGVFQLNFTNEGASAPDQTTYHGYTAAGSINVQPMDIYEMYVGGATDKGCGYEYSWIRKKIQIRMLY